MRMRLLLGNTAIDRVSPNTSSWKQGIFVLLPVHPSQTRQYRLTWASSGSAFPFSIEHYDQKCNFKPFFWNALMPDTVMNSSGLEFSPQCQCRLSSSVWRGAWQTWAMQRMHWEMAQQVQMWTTKRLSGHLAKPSNLLKNHWLSTENYRLPLYC